tara:strand:+ start:51667 stop:52137 length:471 start_codon:yes stop_codon:yes gene_type:complete
MKLHLIRHAQASDSKKSLDIDRNLTLKGKRQVEELSNYLSGKIDRTDVWCSDANRTKETFEIISKNSQFSNVLYRLDLYLCSKEEILDQLWEQSVGTEIVIIGHNFGISDLLNYFTDQTISIRTGEYFCVDFGDLSLKESSKNTGIIVDRFRADVQ